MVMESEREFQGLVDSDSKGNMLLALSLRMFRFSQVFQKISSMRSFNAIEQRFELAMTQLFNVIPN